jgi:alkaline phosphatase D
MLSFPSRRLVLGGLGASALLPAIARSQLRFTRFPFSLGVSAGDATPDGFVLWTRLAPEPLEEMGGMTPHPVPVDWEVAEDDRFKRIVAKGREMAYPELAHSVHAEVTGLQPGRSYHYRFHCADDTSLVGRAATLPAADAAVDQVRFAAVGCQHFEAGWYTAYRHVAEEPLDFVFHYGDYIYEYSPGVTLDAFHRPTDPVRRYIGPEPYSLDEYRRRYAQETLDTDLQAARAAHPWFCTYDDHEVQNNWAGVHDEHGTPPDLFVTRRRLALQAWFEHMPVRRATLSPTTGLVDFRRRADFGRLVRAHFPNTRLFRTDQPCGDNFKPACPAQSAPDAQMIDAAQEKWLGEGLRSSGQTWQLVAQQVMMAPLDRRATDSTEPQPIYNMDSWAGYSAQRERIFGLFGQHAPGNILVATGDEHQNYANDLIHGGRTVASEFVSTSISSGGDGHEVRPGNERLMTDNPNLKWTNDRRGYVVGEVTPKSFTGHYRVLDAVTQKGLPIRTAASWAVESGRPGLQRG